jgi:hypothetical protein
MMGGDFRNGTNIGGAQKYQGNLDYGVLSLSSELPSDKIKIYPNPVSDALQISTTETIKKVTLRTIDGRILLETRENNIDMSRFYKGIFLVDVQAGNTSVSRRIIKN